MEATKLPEATLKRTIKTLRDDYDMEVVFVRDSSVAPMGAQSGKRGRYGFYEIQTWGVLNQARILDKCSKRRSK